jgi:hypothetical protein
MNEELDQAMSIIESLASHLKALTPIIDVVPSSLIRRSRIRDLVDTSDELAASAFQWVLEVRNKKGN